MYALDAGTKFKRNTTGFDYEFGGKRLKYYPDFELDDVDYLEIKGYNSPQ